VDGTISFDLTGRRALVTGSSQGIGEAIALGLLQQGASVAMHAASLSEVESKLIELVRKFGERAHLLEADFRDHSAVRGLEEGARRLLGDIDILILCASIQIRNSWWEISAAEFEEQVDVNLRSSLELIQLCAPPMRERGWGRIVSVGSVQQMKPHPEMLVYAATKAAQANMMRNLARQLAPHGVTVNGISPGVFDTPRNARLAEDPEALQKVIAQIPMQRLGQPLECVGAALLLCSTAGGYITGVELPVDGGMSAT
jgi:glucose 1-dehydrogenase